jgi:ribonuclease PH
MMPERKLLFLSFRHNTLYLITIAQVCHYEERSDEESHFIAGILQPGKTGHIIEVQGTAEGLPFSRSLLDEMTVLATKGIADLTKTRWKY